MAPGHCRNYLFRNGKWKEKKMHYCQLFSWGLRIVVCKGHCAAAFPLLASQIAFLAFRLRRFCNFLLQDMWVICFVLDSIVYRVSQLVMKKPMREIEGKNETTGDPEISSLRITIFAMHASSLCSFRQMLFRTHKTNQSKSVKRKRIPFLCFAHVNT